MTTHFNTTYHAAHGSFTFSCLPMGIAAAALGAAVVRRKLLVLCPDVGPPAGAPPAVPLFDARPLAAGFAAAAADLRFAGCFCSRGWPTL